MLKKLLVEIILLLVVGAIASAQDTTPTPTPAPGRSAAQDKMAELQEQIDLMAKQQAYEAAKSSLANQRLNDLMKAIPRNDQFIMPQGKTTFNDASPTKANPESVALSYEALNELSTQIVAAIRQATSPYGGIVIYNDDDFRSLAKYKLYESLSETALKNYDDLLKTPLKEVTAAKVRVMGDPITTALSLPALGTMFVKSVADLMSVFRTETFIDVTNDTVKDDSIGTAMANELKKARPELKIFYPFAFVPEYEFESEGTESVLKRITDVNAAYADVSNFLSGCQKLDSDIQNDKGNKALIARARDVQEQLKALSLGYGGPGNQNTRSGSENDNPKPGWAEVRQLIRAEKLDRFMRQGNASLGSATGTHIGILKLRLLASGGSRRETRNLFLGNHISYSGSVTVEVLLFDVDGMLQKSEIFSAHTGFRKLKTIDKQIQ